MAIDYWKLTKDFAEGDFVQRVLPGQGITPYMGRVLAVLRGIGFVDIQWPFGTERVSPEELIRVRSEASEFLPPTLTFSYFPGLDVAQSRKEAALKAQWRTTEVPAGFHRELARLYHRGTPEVHAYDELWHRFASATDDDAIRDEVSKFYRFGSNLLDFMLGQVAAKTATYWVSQNRQHRATRAEVDAGCPNCPRCGSPMRKTTYKMREGQRMKLFACPKDLYVIKQDDILGPSGEPVAWSRKSGPVQAPAQPSQVA